MNIRKITKQSGTKLNDSGFSLIELLVSILILILIMVPLMNNFVRALKINHRAEDLQNYSYVSSNFIEKLKSKDYLDVLNNPIYQEIPLVFNASSGNYSRLTGSPDSEKSIYGLVLTDDASVTYDAVLTLDWGNYQYTGTQHEYNNGSKTSQTLMNNYDMPDFAKIDSSVNGMFFAKLYQDNLSKSYETQSKPTNTSLDQAALEEFVSEAKDYATMQLQSTPEYADYLAAKANYETKYQEAVLNGTTLPVPPVEPTIDSSSYYYWHSDYIKPRISKIMNITISKPSDPHEGETKIVYSITYQCNWPTGLGINSTLSYPIEADQYVATVKNVYLYYIFSDYYSWQPDKVNINNSTTSPIDFYLVKQDTDATESTVNISRTGTVNLYTNLDSGYVKENGLTPADINGKQITLTQEDKRIYSIKLELYRYVDSSNTEDKYKELLYTLDTNKGK